MSEWAKREHPVGWIIESSDKEIARFVRQFCPEGEIEKLIDAHNAALEAEYDRGYEDCRALLRKELAAERERTKKLADEWWGMALAAEREKSETLMEALEAIARADPSRVGQSQYKIIATHALKLAKVKEDTRR